MKLVRKIYQDAPNSGRIASPASGNHNLAPDSSGMVRVKSINAPQWKAR